jgi:hypothetical protein
VSKVYLFFCHQILNIWKYMRIRNSRHLSRPPLWSSWSEFLATDPEVPSSGLERGPLSLVRTTEELLEGKVAAPV